jgi:ElaB protein
MASEVGGRVEAAVDQTKRAVTDAYDKTSEVLTNTYNQTMDYGRENPGKLTLIAFGAGIGIGILLASGLGTGGRTTRTSRIAEPVVGALSQIAMEFFR